MPKISIIWFRQDLRISDNPALAAAAKSIQVLPMYCFDPHTPKEHSIGKASQAWLYHSLTALNQSLENKLNFYLGSVEAIIETLTKQYEIEHVFWNRVYEPFEQKKEKNLENFLEKKNIPYEHFNASLLWEPLDVLKKDGTPYKVFTPYYRKGCLQVLPPRNPVPATKQLSLLKDRHNKTRLEDFKLCHEAPWAKKMLNHWKVGEKAAQKQLKHFLESKINFYKKGRDFPAIDKTSKLSPYLHFGEISVHRVWYEARRTEKNTTISANLDCFLSELAWREFSYYLLYHFPTIPTKNFQPAFDHFPWKSDTKHLKAWQQGQTGIPMVDAGMRELWQTGYMHNRVRMIVGSCLVKNLLIHWHKGHAWFWDCLVDADLANNSASWQWVAGSGADAAPYFRIFNPVTQAQKFDPEATYIKKYVPELAELPTPHIFSPWEAPENILAQANVTLGKNYPHPIVDLKTSRERALQAYQLSRK